MYGWSDSAKDGRFGSETVDCYGESLVMLSNKIPHGDVADFACSFEASFIIISKSVEVLPSIVPDEPENRDLVHFYKQRGQWNIIKDEEFQMHQDRLPDICFATRHPIKDFDAIKDNLNFIPNLEDIISRGVKANKNAAFRDVKTTLKNEVIQGQSLYYAKYIVNGEVKEVYSTIDEAREGGNVFDMTPIIFYVMRGPIVELKDLPLLDQTKLFHRVESPNEFLRFSMTDADLDNKEILDIKSPDLEFATKMQNIENFDRDQDFELLRAIDKMRLIDFKGASIDTLKDVQFDPQHFALANNSALHKLDSELLLNRTRLLINFSKSAATLLPSTFFEEFVMDNSIAG
jgi:hypothetical protein